MAALSCLGNGRGKGSKVVPNPEATLVRIYHFTHTDNKLEPIVNSRTAFLLSPFSSPFLWRQLVAFCPQFCRKIQVETDLPLDSFNRLLVGGKATGQKETVA